jgi:hypothetical protein
MIFRVRSQEKNLKRSAGLSQLDLENRMRKNQSLPHDAQEEKEMGREMIS